jgi:hypothetical protein
MKWHPCNQPLTPKERAIELGNAEGKGEREREKEALSMREGEREREQEKDGGRKGET